MSKTFDLSLYLVTDSNLIQKRSLTTIVEEAVKGGVTIVQLREKDASTRDFVELANALKHLLRPYNVPLIINDRIDVALACNADGVHIGQSDMPYQLARQLLGKEKIVGLSVENLQEAIDANAFDVDYIGISPIYATPTKTDTAIPFGLDGIAEVLQHTSHPTVAIGGMNAQTIPNVIKAGVDGVAVVSAIVAATSPQAASSELKRMIEEARKCCLK